MSDVADKADVIELPPAWARLETAIDESIAVLELWRKRAEEAEAEVTRLREALEQATAADMPAITDAARQIRRLQAENTALRSRMTQAQRRVQSLLSWTDALESPE